MLLCRFGVRIDGARLEPLICVFLSGRGDKDIEYVFEHYGYGDEFLKKYE